MIAIKKFWDASIGAALVFILDGLIHIYQLTISPRLGPVCRHLPTCSQYGREAIQTHRAAKGTLLTAWRILRCNPWSSGGYDPVPPAKFWTNNKVVENSTTSDRQVTPV